MPPPPPVEDFPGNEFLKGCGHWIWQRDVGFSELQLEHQGYLGSMLEGTPEEWFTMLSKTRWEVKKSDAHTLWRSSATTDILEIGWESGERVVKGLDGRDYKGHVKPYWEGDKLYTHIYGTNRNSSVDYLTCKEVVDGEYLYTIEDRVKNLKGVRIFRQYPHFNIDNQTRKTLTLTTYSALDLLCVCPSMTVEVRPGKSVIEASSGNVEEEYAYFTLSIRDNTSSEVSDSTTSSEERNYHVKLAAFETYELTPDLFT
mmetsp:Transcript_70460/g.199833  ORF Transcript_70460/g.199833 Transcript_70460/m.199833 type:complete len:257 (-) Transcript_70460:256-1026(-)